MIISVNSSLGEKLLCTCGWLLLGWEIKEKKKKWKRSDKKKKEKREKKALKNKNKKSLNNCANKYGALVWNLGFERSLIEILCLNLWWIEHSLRFRKFFVSISLRNYPLFVHPTMLQPLKPLLFCFCAFQ